MSKLNNGNGGSSADWQKKAEEAWNEAIKVINNQKTGGIYGFVGTISDKNIREADEAFKDVDNCVAYEKAVELIKKLADEKALIVGTKQGGIANGLEVKKPSLSIYKDTLTIEFGRTKANKDAMAVGLKAVLNKDGEVTGVYASTAEKEIQKKDGTGSFIIPDKYRAYEKVENLPEALKKITDAIGFANPVRERAEGEVELPKAVNDIYQKMWDKVKTANETAPKGFNQEGKEVNQFYASASVGRLTEKGNFDNREGVDGVGAGYQLSLADHAKDGQNKLDITLDENGNILNGKITDFGTKDENGKFASVFSSNLEYLCDRNKNIEIAKMFGEVLKDIGYKAPEYKKDEKEAEEPEKEEAEEEAELPFK